MVQPVHVPSKLGLSGRWASQFWLEVQLGPELGHGEVCGMGEVSQGVVRCRENRISRSPEAAVLSEVRQCEVFSGEDTNVLPMKASVKSFLGS